MSFADRYRYGKAAPSPDVPVVVLHTPPPKIAKNENNFIPTKYGEELPNAIRSFLPRNLVAGSTARISATPHTVIDINSSTAFPSLIASTPSKPLPVTMNWAQKVRG